MQTREKNGRQNKYKYSDFCARARRKSPLCDRHWPNWKNSGYTQYYIQQPLQPNREKTTERKLFKNIIKCYNCIFRFVNQNLLHSIRWMRDRDNNGRKKRGTELISRYAKYPWRIEWTHKNGCEKELIVIESGWAFVGIEYRNTHYICTNEAYRIRCVLCMISHIH